jgi:zinc-ribbon domain
MYCPKCGTEIPDTSTFCLKCGYKVIDPEQILRSHKTSNILFISTIAVVILGIGALYLLLRNQQDNQATIAANSKPSPTPTPLPSPSPTPSPSPSPTPLTDIRAVNFRKMSYRVGNVLVPGGENAVQSSYGDLNGDGVEEAVVTVTYSTGENQALSKGFVYAIKDGKAQRIADFDGGDSANGGSLKAQIIDGKVEVERCRADEADNSLSIETTTYQLEDTKLSTLDKKKRKTDKCP